LLIKGRFFTWLVWRCVLVRSGEGQGRSSFCEQKEAKKLHDGAQHPWGWRPCPLRPSEVARRMKFFARFFSKKRRLLADTPRRRNAAGR
jgi:hypothetical protein